MEKQNLFGENNNIIVYADGGARGNPGPAACGYVINGRSYGEYLGETTNNEAEYRGVIEALKKIIALFGKEKAAEAEIEVRMDSELLVKQFNNEYKVKVEHLVPLYVEVHNLTLDFKKVVFKHIPREENSVADRMVNRILDNRSG